MLVTVEPTSFFDLLSHLVRSSPESSFGSSELKKHQHSFPLTFQKYHTQFCSDLTKHCSQHSSGISSGQWKNNFLRNVSFQLFCQLSLFLVYLQRSLFNPGLKLRLGLGLFKDQETSLSVMLCQSLVKSSFLSLNLYLVSKRKDLGKTSGNKNKIFVKTWAIVISQQDCVSVIRQGGQFLVVTKHIF